MIEPPIPLGESAMQRWREVVSLKAWRPQDVSVLAAYCAAWGRWVDAERWLADPKHGPVLTIRDDKGNVKSHGAAPQVAISEKAAKEVHRLGKILRV